MDLAGLVAAVQEELRFDADLVDQGAERQQTPGRAARVIVETRCSFDELVAMILEIEADSRIDRSKLLSDRPDDPEASELKDVRDVVVAAVVQLVAIQGLTLAALVEKATAEFWANPTFEDHGDQPQFAYTAVCEVIDELSDVEVICRLIVELAADKRVNQSGVAELYPPSDDNYIGYLRPVVRSGMEQILLADPLIGAEQDRRYRSVDDV